MESPRRASEGFGYITMGHSDLPDDDSPSPMADDSPTPTRDRPERAHSQTRAAVTRRGSVSTACERCRRRKIRCSGLPGPCSSCAKFGVRCVDPGKRKPRSQSVMEDRIKRLEAMVASSNPFDNIQSVETPAHEVNPEDLYHARRLSAGPLDLHIQTSNLPFQTQFNDANFSHTAFNTDPWGQPSSPACYSDIGPEIDGFWSSQFPQPLPQTFDPVPLSSLHRRSNTFPAISTDQQYTLGNDSHTLASPAYSDIPSIEITSHDVSRSQSPAQFAGDGTFALPIRAAMPEQLEDWNEPVEIQEYMRTPPMMAQDPGFAETNADYYGVFLSPLDRPPTLPRRPSLTSPVDTPSSVADWNTRGRTTARRHTTSGLIPTSPSISPPAPSTPRLSSPELLWMLDSPRTTSCIKTYFNEIHPHYPFLNKIDFLQPTSTTLISSSSFHHSAPSTNPTPTKTYQRLLTAAIGALIQHKSRDISARYVRHAMTMHSELDDNMMWSTIPGLHAAMLLAIYCLLEYTTDFSAEEEQGSDVSHPDVNLWMWNCRIAAGCIDLGLHQMSDSFSRNWDEDEDEDDEEEADQQNEETRLYTDTFCAAYKLDSKISEVRKRPRAFHDGDIDGRLLKTVMNS